jgi:threonine dehydrogenase-like Zn-dependent dehydrogenase
MNTLALRLYGANDLRLENFQLPKITENEILAEVVTNSICMSTYKATRLGTKHKRIPNDVAQNPIIVGHEISGTILEVGDAHKDRFTPGQKYSIQPNMVCPIIPQGAAGYSYPHMGGHATHIILPAEVMEQGCLLPYEGEGFFRASLSEPLSCIVGAFNTSCHLPDPLKYQHENGIVDGGTMAILAGTGPMGLGAIDYALHGPKRPRRLVVTGISQERLDHAAAVMKPDEARAQGIELHFVNVKRDQDPITKLRNLNEGEGYDDIFVFVPDPEPIEQADALLGYGGCLNFFAGPEDTNFKVPFNFYHIHYSLHRVVGSSGGNTDDMRKALDLMAKGEINPALLVTHVGGIDSAADTIMNLPKLPGAKKLIYTHKSMPLTAIEDFPRRGETDPFFKDLAEITERHNGLWSIEAENYLLKNRANLSL